MLITTDKAENKSEILLNPTQQKAVEHPIDAPLKVIAGAGTGKTRVLTYRFVHILKSHHDIEPHNILALTFTNKAANEMQERIIALAKEEGIFPPDSASPPLMWIGTFHSFCGRILRENAFSAGLDPSFTVISEADSRQIHHRIVDDFVNLRLDTGSFKPVNCRYVTFDRPQFLYSHLFTFISRLKDQLVKPEDFRDKALKGMIDYYHRLASLRDEVRDNNKLHPKTREALQGRLGENLDYEYAFEAEIIELIYHIYRAYQNYLYENDMLDFGDLLSKAYDLLNSNYRIRRLYQERFKYILIDEFQDTNEAQMYLLRLIAKDERLSNVTVVGDDKQAIYAWRNARVENVDDFIAEEWGGQSLNISKNYRSYGEILEIAHHSIIQDEKFKIQSHKIKLEPEKLGMANQPIVTLYEAGNRENEANFIAREIARLLNEGYQPGDIVILMRSVRSAKVYEDALRKAKIPYLTVGGVGFYDRQEIRDILAYLKVIDNPFDMLALVRVLKRPPIWLSDRLLYELSDRKRNELLFDRLSRAREILSDHEAVRRIERLVSFVDDIWSIMGKTSILYLISRIIEDSGYLRYISEMPKDERERCIANIKKLLRMADEFEKRHFMCQLSDFVQYLQFSMDQLLREGEAGSESASKAVQIMTIHQAKGLEFDFVFVINAKNQSFPTIPRYPVFNFDRDDGLILNITNKDGNKFFKFLPYDLKGNSDIYDRHRIKNYYEKYKRDHFSEERRIWYVAVTRAKQRLYLSYPDSTERSKQSKGRTDFFLEIHNEFIDALNICRFLSFSDSGWQDNNDISEVGKLSTGEDEDVSDLTKAEDAERINRELMKLISFWESINDE